MRLQMLKKNPGTPARCGCGAWMQRTPRRGFIETRLLARLGLQPYLCPLCGARTLGRAQAGSDRFQTQPSGQQQPRLQLASSNLCPSHSPDAAPPPAAPRRTILLVEDEESVRRLATRALLGTGFAVVAAASSEQALETFGAHGIDLILTDVVLPVLNGPELVARLRDQMLEVPVIYMSGYSRQELVRSRKLAAGVQILPKPFAIDQLCRMVSEKLETEPRGEPVGDATSTAAVKTRTA